MAIGNEFFEYMAKIHKVPWLRQATEPPPFEGVRACFVR